MFNSMDTLIRRLRHIRPIMEVLRSNRGSDEGEGSGKGAGEGEGQGEGTGGEEGKWYDNLGEEAGKDTNITKYKTSEDFYKGYKSQVEMIGKKGIIPPGENSTPEEKETYLNALGRPEAPEGYKIDTIEGLHESISITPESSAEFQAAAHKMGFTNQQANDLNSWYLNAVSEQAKQSAVAETDAMQKAETTLRAEWGEKFDANKQMVASMVLNAGGQEAIDAMGGVDGIGNNPVVLKTLGKIAGLLSEDQIGNLKPVGQQVGGNESQQDASTKINAMNTDKDSPWHKALWDESDLKHDQAVSERNRLYKIAYPGGDV